MAGRRVAHIATASISPVWLMRDHLRALRAAGAEVHVICGPDEFLDMLRAEDVHVHTVHLTRRMAPLADARAFVELTLLLRRIRPDVVHTYTPKASLFGQWAAWLARVPFRVGSHFGFLVTGDTRGLRRVALLWLERLAAWPAHVIVSLNPEQMQFAIEERIAPASRLRPWTLGIDLDRFNPQVREALRRDARARLGLSDDTCAVGMLGRVSAEKGFATFVGAGAVLGGKAVQFLWAGPFDRIDEATATLAARAAEGVRFLGPVDDQRDFLAAMDVIFFPSLREGMPVVLQEAAAMGLPIVTTDAPGCRNAVADGVTGRVFRAGDSDAAIATLREVIGDRAAAAALGAGAARWAAEHADRRQGIRDLFGIYAAA